MKTFTTILNLLLILMFSACHVHDPGPIDPNGIPGPQGPRGADGRDGYNGVDGKDGKDGEDGESSYVFEFDQINFVAPDYEVLLPYPNDFEPLDSDVALVYLLWDVQEIDGEDVEIWRPLPQTLLTEDGLLQYNFDFTKYDVNLFLDAEFPLDWLTAIDTDDWIARVVVVPGNFWNSGGRQGIPSYDELKEQLNLKELSTPISHNKRRTTFVD